MTNGAIWQMSACELAATITRGDVSCVEAVSSVVNRVAETNGEVNAIVTDLDEPALTQAIEKEVGIMAQELWMRQETGEG